MNNPCATLVFVCGGCNRTPHAAAWGRKGYVAYGAHNAVVVYDPRDVRVVCTLQGHTGRVNAVRWMNKGDDTDEDLFSGGSDHCVQCWRVQGEPVVWNRQQTLKGHEAAVTCIAALPCVVESTQQQNGVDLLASTSADSTVRVWTRSASTCKDGWCALQTLFFAPHMMHAVDFARLPASHSVVMVVGGTEFHVHAYLRTENGQFTRSFSLRGHQDWIRSLAFAACDDGSVLLASASQDTRVRLWHFSTDSSLLLESDEAKLQSSSAVRQLSHKGHAFTDSNNQKFMVVLDAILYGHEDWVHAVDWCPPQTVKDSEGVLVPHQPMLLLTASMDHTLMLWSPDTATGIWTNQVRVGQLSGWQSVGYYGGGFGPDGASIMAHGYDGAVQLWRWRDETETWNPSISPTGHVDAVEDVSWDPQGDYIVSVSVDQTTRLFVPWRDNERQLPTWHELARPQIHGYDLHGIAFTSNVPHRIVSCADEKVVRVFDAPQGFIDSLAAVARVQTRNGGARPSGALQPELGLSNKALFQDGPGAMPVENPSIGTMPLGEDGEEEDEEMDRVARSTTLFPSGAMTRPPVEEMIAQNTLWPEVNKLYGHGNEVMCVACNHCGTVLASACRATNAVDAEIIIWDTCQWKERCRLRAHTLTIVQLEFSHDDKSLLAASRDRQFSVFESRQEGFGVVAHVKAHDRIIWSCSWSHDNRFIVTGSRDKKVKVWGRGTSPPFTTPCSVMTFSEAVTACSMRDAPQNSGHLLAVGLENGFISLWHGQEYDELKIVMTQVLEIDARIAHVDAVRRLRWRPEAREDSVLLASCSADHTVRVYAIDFPSCK